jgi:butyryl-CoA dehydrogenase
MRNFQNCTAVVTGAGSGIGRALALRLAGMGANLAVCDINGSALDDTAEMLGAFDIKVRADAVDVTDQEVVMNYAKSVQDDFGHVNLVINNAGAALNGEFSKLSLEDIGWQMDVNFWGVAHGTKAFLPILEQAEWGHIVNISSIFGMVSVPGNSAYNASKFAVRGMTEALRHELKMAGSTVSCTTVNPGGVKTNIVRNARTGRNNGFMGGRSKDEMITNFDKLARTTPEKAAKIILTGAAKDKMRVLVGFDAWLVDKIQRLFPTLYFPVMVKVLGYGKELVE